MANKLILAGAVVIGVLYFYLRDTTPSSFDFMQTEYHFVKEKSQGGISYIYFVPEGDSFESATELIQILEFDDGFSDKQTDQFVAQLANFYHAEMVYEDPDEHFGFFTRGGTTTAVYGAQVIYDNEDCYAFYLVDNFDEGEAAARAMATEIFDELAHIE